MDYFPTIHNDIQCIIFLEFLNPLSSVYCTKFACGGQRNSFGGPNYQIAAVCIISRLKREWAPNRANRPMLHLVERILTAIHCQLLILMDI